MKWFKYLYFMLALAPTLEAQQIDAYRTLPGSRYYESGFPLFGIQDTMWTKLPTFIEGGHVVWDNDTLRGYHHHEGLGEVTEHWKTQDIIYAQMDRDFNYIKRGATIENINPASAEFKSDSFYVILHDLFDYGRDTLLPIFINDSIRYDTDRYREGYLAIVLNRFDMSFVDTVRIDMSVRINSGAAQSDNERLYFAQKFYGQYEVLAGDTIRPSYESIVNDGWVVAFNYRTGEFDWHYYLHCANQGSWFMSQDHDENLIVTGISNYRHFVPAPGDTLPEPIVNNNFILKFDRDGNYIWGKNTFFGGTFDRETYIDHENNIYWRGYYYYTEYRYDDTIIYKNDPRHDDAVPTMVIKKLSSDGEFQWLYQVAGDYRSAGMKDIVFDDEGNAYVYGVFGRGILDPLNEGRTDTVTFYDAIIKLASDGKALGSFKAERPEYLLTYRDMTYFDNVLYLLVSIRKSQPYFHTYLEHYDDVFSTWYLAELSLEGLSTTIDIEDSSDVIAELFVHPNPVVAGQELTADVSMFSDDVWVKLVDQRGRQVYHEQHDHQGGQVQLRVPSGLLAGQYYLLLSDKTGNNKIQKIILH